MATYFVGDIQGCFDEFKLLLNTVNFNPSQDTLWSCGDLIARGPKSLETLSYFSSSENSAQTVLGNHDLHFLAVSENIKKENKQDKLTQLLNAPDLPQLTNWLRQQPLLHEFPSHNVLLCHAGIPPCWDLVTLKEQTKKIHKKLISANYSDLLKNMYGNSPCSWNTSLSEDEQERYTINALTRMRFLYSDLSMDFEHKSATVDNSELKPWFQYPSLILKEHKVIFGHWASIIGKTNNSHAIALDTGCVWGNQLTLWHLEKDEKIHQDALTRS